MIGEKPRREVEMKSWTRLLIAGFVIPAIAATATGIAMRAEAPAYPATRKVEVVEDYHGTPVADPYRWLEDLGSAETRGWIASQNAVTFKYLEGIPLRDTIRKRITELWDYPK